MEYRAPRYSYVHAARDVGASAITVSDTAHADFPKDNLIDGRAATLFKWSAPVTNPTIAINLGSGFVTGLDRLIIPADHNIDGADTITVQQADDSGFSTNLETLHAADASSDAGVLYDSGTFDTASSSRQYIRITITGTAQYYLPQIFLTEIIFGSATAPGPNLADSPDGHKANATTLEQNTGLRPTIQHGPQQRIIEYDYESPLSGAHLIAMEAFIAAVGVSKPFYVDPASFSTPPSTDEPALAMKFADMPIPRNSILVPMSGTRSKIFTLSLIESLD